MSFNTTSLGEVANFINGYAFKPEHWGTEGKPIIRIQNLTNPAKEYNYTTFEVDEKYKVTSGDILVSWSATLDVFEWNQEDALVNQHIFKVIPDYTQVNKSYFRYALKRSIEAMMKYTRGSTMKHINRGDFLATQILLPPLTEQKRIAAILDKADAIRRKRQAAIKLTGDLLSATFLDLFGDPVTNPKDWEEVPLHGIANIVSGVTKGRNFYGKKTVYIPYMRVANIQDGHIDLGEIKEIEALETDIDKYALQNGDILLTEGGDPDKLGRGAVWRAKIKPCIHQNHIFRVRVDSSKIAPEYLSALIGSARGKRYFLRAAKQTTGIASINMTQLKGFPALLPSLDLQNKYVILLNKYESLVVSKNKSFKKNQELFNSLTQRAFRGEL